MYLILPSVLLEGMAGLDPLSCQQDIKVEVTVSMCKPETVKGEGKMNSFTYS
jgi:hypothetical protein